MKSQAQALPSSPLPTRVFDAPGVHDGAFGFMNAPTEMMFWRGTAPPSANLQVQVSSSLEWETALHELGAAAAARTPLRAFAVRWHDGSLEPMPLDTQWPLSIWPGTTIGYARIAPQRPFVGDTIAVELLLQSDRSLRVRADIRGLVGAQPGIAVSVLPTASHAAVRVPVALPATLGADAAVAIILVFEQGEESHSLELGTVRPVHR
jgi:hypothetical protein